MSELKPCPFCHREKAKVDTKQKLDRHLPGGKRVEAVTASVRCMVCFARGPAIGGKVRPSLRLQEDEPMPEGLTTYKDLKERAIAAWNRGAAE